MIEVFRTNITGKMASRKISEALHAQFPDLQVHFDLEDCDRILRVDGDPLFPEMIAELVKEKGYDCEMLK
jgi:hypothetical protein